MPINVTLNIGSEKYDILHCRYGFGRQVSSKGLPGGGMNGGDIYVTMESTESCRLLEELIRKDGPQPISGNLEFCDVEEDTLIRKFEWEQAFIYAVEETMHGNGSLPMTLTLAISPLRLDINGTIRIDRRFPQTSGFWWEEYKPEEQTVVAASEDDDSYTITDAYWLDEENNQIRDLNVETPVTLYVVLGEYTAGSTIELSFEGEADENVKTAKYTVTVADDGVVVIENFKLEPQNEEGRNNG